MALFENCSVVLELKTLPHKEKKRLALTLTEHGGSISYVVNKQCSLVVASSVSSLSSNRLRSIQKHHTPVVAVDYIYSCVERGVLLPVDQYELDTSPSPLLPLSSQRPDPPSQPVSNVTTSTQGSEQSITVNVVSQTTKAGRQANVVDQLRGDTENLSDVPTFPSDFQVAKYSIFEKAGTSMWGVVELQSATGEEGQRYRVLQHTAGTSMWGVVELQSATGEEGQRYRVLQHTVSLDKVVLVSTSEEAVETYQSLRQELLEAGLTLTNTLHPQASVLVSAALKQLRLEENLNTRSVSQEVGVFVELLWREAQGCLGNVLKVPISRLSLNDVSRAEGLLLQIWKKVKENTFSDVSEIHSATEDFYTLLPHRENDKLLNNANIISHKLDLCQLIRDLLNVSEETSRSPFPSCLGKYRALRCGIENVPPDSIEFKDVSNLLRHSNVQVQQMLRVSRGAELHTFRKELGNIRLLLHASSPSSFVGILSRGLLLPTVGVKHHGIERTDIGDLGSGIYFSDSISTSLKYSKPSATDGSRLLLVCDVALGECRDLHRKDPSLCQAPEGYHSVHGVRQTPGTQSEFQDDEFVVYSTDQVKLRFVIQFTVEGDQLQEFHPSVDTSSELPPPSTPSSEILSDEDSIWSSENPLDKVTAGLLDSSGQQLPLQAVHVKCKLMDLLSQVIIFQKYTNQSSVPIEAKYVFPLDDCAAVCGFEAFINGKHVVGQVKEKEKARKEYKEAVAKGHGAYLMDQDAPDVFTISVGNLPPGATVLIKVTFVSELIVRDGHVVFSLPGSVAPWQESAALNQTTQATVKKVCVTDLDTKGEFSLDMSIDMPNEITSLKCDSHKVRIKKTACKAVVSVVPGEVLGPDGFQLSIKLSQIHLPRMWVENHPDKDSQASMLVFYPDFEVSSSGHVGCDEVVLLLDSSESMRGEALRNARAIALKLLTDLRSSSRRWKANVILFGTEHKDAFLAAQECKVSDSAKKFIQSHPPVGGSTELWRPLRALSLLPPSRGLRNLLLLSDGHIQNPDLTLRLVRDAAQHSRLFTCGLSPTANRHMLRALAQAGGGAYEFFDTKTKHTWSAKVSSQVRRMASPGCSSVSVKWQQFNPRAPSAVQAPAQLHALFNDCHTLVYGFVPHCTQASLHGNLSGQEINTMVSTSELQKTKGTFLHKLTARALIKDYEDGNLGSREAEHEEKKAELKSFIVELSKEYSILSQFTSFVAIEERDSERPQQQEDFTDVHKLVSEEDVDFLPYLTYSEEEDLELLDYEEDICDDVTSDDVTSDDEGSYHERSYGRCRGSPAEETLSCLPSSPAEEMMEMEDIYEDMIYDESSPALHDPGTLCVSSSLFSNSAPMALTQRSTVMSRTFFAAPPPSSSSSYDSPHATLNLSLKPLPTLQRAAPPGAYIPSSFIPTVTCPTPSGGLFGLSSPPPPPPPPSSSYIFPHAAVNFAAPPSIGVRRSSRPRQSLAVFGAPAEPLIPHSIPLGAPPPYPHPAMGAPQPLTPPSALGAPQPLTTPDGVFFYRPMPRTCSAPPPPVMMGSASALPPPPPPPTSFSPSGGLFGLSSPPPLFSPCQESGWGAGGGVGASPTITPPSALGAPPPRTPLSALGAPKHPIPLSHLGAPLSRTPPSAQGGPIRFDSPCYGSLSMGASQPFGSPFAWGAVPAESEYKIKKRGRKMGFPGALPPPPPLPSKSLSVALYLGAPLSLTPPSTMGAPPPLTPPSAMDPSICYVQPPIPPSALGAPPPLTVTLAPRVTVVTAPQSTLHSMGASRSIIGRQSLEYHEYAPAIRESVPAELKCKSRLAEGRTFRVMGEGEDRLEQRSQQLLPRQQLQFIQQVRQQKQLLQQRVELMQWVSIFLKQHPEGYWECTAELGGFIRVDLHSFANVFLKSKGIFSLGVRARADILRLLATLLVLQLMRGEQLEEGKLLRSLFSLEEASPLQARPERWEAVKKAVDWACWADRQYPCVCSRLEMGWSWESSTRQLLGYDQPAPHSPLAGLTHWRLGAVGGFPHPGSVN